MSVQPLRKRTMGLDELRNQTRAVLKKCRKQLMRKAHEEGLSDSEFIDQVINPLETDIWQDVQVEKMQAHRVPNMPLQSTPTNCFAACIATVLGCSIEQVPKGADGASWDFAEVQKWLSDEFGLQILEVTFGSGGTIYPMATQVPCIITGPSPRECVTGRHAVVAMTKGLLGFEMVHDPHESGAGLGDEPTHASFFIPVKIEDVFMCDRENY